MQRFGSRSGLSVFVVAAWGMLFAAAQLGLYVPGIEDVFGSRSGRLDYSSRPGSLEPLSEAYIDSILGPDRDDHGEAGTFRATAHRPGSVVSPTQRQVVEHRLTNDHWKGAQTIDSVPYTARTDTSLATGTDEPRDCGTVGGAVWYRYTPPRNVGLIAYTFGTDHVVTLGVYTRDSNAWQLQHCEDDTSESVLYTFDARAGTAYYFQVGAPLGGGKLIFSLDPRGSITNLSVNPTTRERGDDFSWIHNMSSDGSRVAFLSYATNLGYESPRCPDATTETYALFNTRCTHAYVRDATGKLLLVSSSDTGEPGNSFSEGTFISGDGRFAVFESDASNLTAGDTTGIDLFVKDLETGSVERVASSDVLGGPRTHHHLSFNIGDWMPSMSDDGGLIAFQTPLPFDSADTNEEWDVYVVTRRAPHRFTWISVPFEGAASGPRIPVTSRDVNTGNGKAVHTVDLTPFISGSGHHVVFRAPFDDLVHGDTNGTWDTFVRDLRSGMTERVSISSQGRQANGPSIGRSPIYTTPTISRDGRFVVFDSLADNLDRVDTPGAADVFVRDRLEGTTRAIGVSVAADPATLRSDEARLDTPVTPHFPSISAGGRFVTYSSFGLTTKRATCEGTVGDDLYECSGQVLVYDILTKTTFPIAVMPSGEDFWGFGSTVSDDGRRVAFQSYDAKDRNRDYVDDAGRPLFEQPLQVFMYEAAR